jgi:hypothetical protein
MRVHALRRSVRIVRKAGMLCVLAALSACDSKPPDWNSLVSARIRDQYPNAQIKVTGEKSLEATLNGKTIQVDTADLGLQCNRGPRDCDRAVDQVLLELGASAKK